MSRFKQWMDLMGFNGKQVSEAGEAIGAGYETVRTRLARDDRPTKTELLAMSAVRAGLPPWSPEEDADIAKVQRMRKLISEVA